MGSTGSWFTWCNGQRGYQHIRGRLVKALANGEWTTLFLRALIRNLPQHSSDHAPLLLSTEGAMGACPKSFYFEGCWTRNEYSKAMVAGVWRIRVRGSASFRLV